MKLRQITENIGDYEGLEDADEFQHPALEAITNGVAAEHFASLPSHREAEVILVHPDSDARQYKHLMLNIDELIVDIS